MTLKKSIQIRPLQVRDLSGIKNIIELNQMFPVEMLDDMTSTFLTEDGADEFWCVAFDEQDNPLCVAYCAPEYMTQGTWNLLLIAVLPEYQGTGIGTDTMAHVENLVKLKQGRLLLVETSGLPDFSETRAFYPKCGYSQVAVIPEFYDAGDDKVVFSKNLIGN